MAASSELDPYSIVLRLNLAAFDDFGLGQIVAALNGDNHSTFVSDKKPTFPDSTSNICFHSGFVDYFRHRPDQIQVQN